MSLLQLRSSWAVSIHFLCCLSSIAPSILGKYNKNKNNSLQLHHPTHCLSSFQCETISAREKECKRYFFDDSGQFKLFVINKFCICSFCNRHSFNGYQNGIKYYKMAGNETGFAQRITEKLLLIWFQLNLGLCTVVVVEEKILRNSKKKHSLNIYLATLVCYLAEYGCVCWSGCSSHTWTGSSWPSSKNMRPKQVWVTARTCVLNRSESLQEHAS
jgi:hypothetical protein